jgi:hypothetical protein
VIDSRRLLSDLQRQQRTLEADLRAQITAIPELATRLQSDYRAAAAAGRTGDTFGAWSENEITQAAVAWLLACTFVRFCEDNGLIATPMLAGPDDAMRRAKDAATEYFRAHPTENDRHYLEQCFDQMAQLPAVAGLFGRAHNPLFALPLSFEAARGLLVFWQSVNPDTGALRHDFRDDALNTRFLGDLYQDLSEAARKRFALLQTPEFVEEFILDRTLEPAIRTFGLQGIRLIDPTCGSGHFLLGAFQRLLAHGRTQAPGLDAREHVIYALSGIYGVDLNPFATAIARFRLLVAALQASGIRTLREAPNWHFNLTTGDSLLHGRRFDQLDLGADDVTHRYQHAYAAEDIDEINRILGQQYHAVVGNPPYITASDSALNVLYRQRYKTCSGTFSLGVPFTERFFQLTLHNGDAQPGYVGMITTDSFMKREFGKKFVEDYLPQQDLTHVIHMSGIEMPGHGTPTVILFGRNRKPIRDELRAVLGIRADKKGTGIPPKDGPFWNSIVQLVDKPECSNDYISVSDMERASLATHPWSLQGGCAPDVLETINDNGTQKLSECVHVIGRTTHTGEDDVFYWPPHVAKRIFPSKQFVDLVIGENIRDWTLEPDLSVVMPYDLVSAEVLPYLPKDMARVFWNFRATLRKRRDFGNYIEDRGLQWFEQSMFFPERYKIPLSVAFAFVATHNHFVLDRGGKVFKQTAPVIKLPKTASENDHLGLLGLLNSSTACFWLKQVCFNKGRGDEHWTDRFEHDATKVAQFPIVSDSPLELIRNLDGIAQCHTEKLPVVLASRLPLTRAQIDAERDQAASLLAQMIATQEELDWWCYHAYGLLDEALCIGGTPPEIHLGERAFEIVLARRIAAGTSDTTWFARHGSTPITELPARWPADYRALVQRRIDLSNPTPGSICWSGPNTSVAGTSRAGKNWNNKRSRAGCSIASKPRAIGPSPCCCEQPKSPPMPSAMPISWRSAFCTPASPASMCQRWCAVCCRTNRCLRSKRYATRMPACANAPTGSTPGSSNAPKTPSIPPSPPLARNSTARLIPNGRRASSRNKINARPNKWAACRHRPNTSAPISSAPPAGVCAAGWMCRRNASSPFPIRRHPANGYTAGQAGTRFNACAPSQALTPTSRRRVVSMPCI